jgi:DNA (cytosine-5)-methyltransferase 1
MKQVNIFDYLPDNKFKFTKKIRLIEMFAGIGTQAMALKTLCKLKGHPFELYKISEWNTSATKSYHAVHYENDVTDYSKEMTKDEVLECLKKFGISSDGKKSLEEKQILRKGEKWMRDVYNDFIATHNVGSITNIHAEDLGIVETDKYEYLFCYSFPCQDLSLAGKRAGMEKGSGTRSGLLWEVERLLKQCDELPTVLLMENVTQVHGTKNQKSWAQWLEALEEMGYRNYWMDMNSKMYGIPQNRNRTIMISILGDYNYEFVKGFPLKIRLKDMLEDEVDEKYYISEKAMRCFDSEGTGKYPRRERFRNALKHTNEKQLACTIRTGEGGKPESNYIITKEGAKVDDLE